MLNQTTKRSEWCGILLISILVLPRDYERELVKYGNSPFRVTKMGESDK